MSISEEVSFDNTGHIEKYPLFKKLSLALIIILVASLGYGVGRLSVVGKREPIRIEYDTSISNDQFLISKQAPSSNGGKVLTASVVTATQSNNTVIASKNSNKYHFPDCPGAKQIKEANKITFASPEAARGAGYTLASNCQSR